MAKDVGVVRNPLFLEHRAPGGHVECPDRVASIYSLFSQSKEFSKLSCVEPQEITEAQLLQVHSQEMVKKILSEKGKSGWFDADTFYCDQSIDVASIAAGSTLSLAQSIWSQELRRGFSLVRPPGHHATAEEPMGFCLFNHLALSVASLLDAHPGARISVVDFDLHHGNGTQWIFYDNPNVQVISSHRYPYYPGTGAQEELGVGKAIGSTVNFPLGSPMAADFFEAMYFRLVRPMITSFQPDMILVSAGYDGHREDPMQGFLMSTSCFQHITRILLGLAEKHCQGRILFCLEGGYNPDILKECVQMTLSELIHFPRSSTNDLESRHPGAQEELIEGFLKYYAPYYPEIS